MDKIRSALISVYHKENLEPILEALFKQGISLFSTGGTLGFIEEHGYEATPVESLTNYPSIFGGRVKTLHPRIFGGILFRRENESDIAEAGEYEIPAIDLVVVDLYPFEATVASGASEDEVVEKVDIGGISLIRAAAKNYQDVVIISSREQYGQLLDILNHQQAVTSLKERRELAAEAFNVSSNYDTAIFNHFSSDTDKASLKLSLNHSSSLRYGENPHQTARFYGRIEDLFDQIQGKALSFNNLVDIDAGLHLISEFENECAFIILKHTNACGAAVGPTVTRAYQQAFEVDTLSAFGGVLITNGMVDLEAAEAMNSLFFEVLVATDFSAEAIEILGHKKNRILLKQKSTIPSGPKIKSLLHGVIQQDEDDHTDSFDDLKIVTQAKPDSAAVEAMIFASKICKHTKSNAIVLARDGQLLASGVGQTSRIDALKQAIEKAKSFGLSLAGATMASDAFFPFPDCVEVAHQAGITSIIQPGGSVKDQLSVDYCNDHIMSMAFTGYRHFKH